MTQARIGRINEQVLNQDPAPDARIGRLNAQVLSGDPNVEARLGRLNIQVLQSLTLELTGEQTITVGIASEAEAAGLISPIVDQAISVSSVIESEDAQTVVVDQESLEQSILVGAVSELETANITSILADQLVPVVFAEEAESAGVVNLAGAETAFIGWGIPI